MEIWPGWESMGTHEKSAKMGRGISISTYKSGTQAIRLSFTFRGARCRETLPLEPTPQNLKYATGLLAEINTRISRDTFCYSDYFPDSKTAAKFGHQISRQTVGEGLIEWMADAKLTKKHSTWRSYNTAVKTWLLPHLGSIQFVDLRPRHIRDLVRAMNVNVKTINNRLLPLRGTIRRALADEIISVNPLDAINVAELVTPSQKRSSYQVDPFTANELRLLLVAVEKLYGANGRNLVQFHAFTGLRTGELFALEWEQIGQEIRIDRNLVDGRPASTKTVSGERDVPILPGTEQALRSQRAITALEGGRVFRGLHGGALSHYWQHYSKPFKRACQLAGVRYRNPYQLRHTFASQMLSGGENPLRVAKILGHKDPQMVFRVYGKWIEQGQEFVSDWAKNVLPTSSGSAN